MSYQDVLNFWFNESGPNQWFAKDAAFDALIRQRFSATHATCARGERWQWRDHAAGRLAEVIVLDQFSRNMFRDQPESFACDPMALVLAQEAVRVGADQALPVTQRAFLYLPYMHSESLRVHAEAEHLFAQPGLEANLKYERMHKAILERFGRYPHRNAVLGRVSTAEELAFLQQPGSSF